MPKQKIGKIPDFTDENSQEQETKEENKSSVEGNEEVKQAEGEKPSEEKETPDDTSASEKPADQEKEEVSDDTGKTAIQGLEAEREKLLVEIQKLRGTRRDLRQKQEEKPEEVEKKEEKDVSTDVHPKDREIIKKVLETEGYVKKDEAAELIYKDVEQQQLNEWLNAHPEFKPENDPEDRNWTALMAEYNLYRKPKDASETKEFLERARKAISPPTPASEQDAKKTQAKQKMETAGMGSGGVQGSSPSGLSIPEGMTEEGTREMLSRGGYTNEEIDELLKTK